MPWKSKPPPAGPDGGSGRVWTTQNIGPQNTPNGAPVQVALIPRPVRPDEIPELRRMWWQLTADGNQLPAEAGIILLDGGRYGGA